MMQVRHIKEFTVMSPLGYMVLGTKEKEIRNSPEDGKIVQKCHFQEGTSGFDLITHICLKNVFTLKMELENFLGGTRGLSR